LKTISKRSQGKIEGGRAKEKMEKKLQTGFRELKSKELF
jgi:hypothetical protein